VHSIAIRLCGVAVAPRVCLGFSLLFMAIVGSLTASAQPSSPLYWTIREDALFSSQWRLNGADGATMEILPGRALVAMLVMGEPDRFGLQAATGREPNSELPTLPGRPEISPRTAISE
jgi:hypothetical protein